MLVIQYILANRQSWYNDQLEHNCFVFIEYHRIAQLDAQSASRSSQVPKIVCGSHYANGSRVLNQEEYVSDLAIRRLANTQVPQGRSTACLHSYSTSVLGHQ